jgi:hypothetical protein
MSLHNFFQHFFLQITSALQIYLRAKLGFGGSSGSKVCTYESDSFSSGQDQMTDYGNCGRVRPEYYDTVQRPYFSHITWTHTHEVQVLEGCQVSWLQTVIECR